MCFCVSHNILKVPLTTFHICKYSIFSWSSIHATKNVLSYHALRLESCGFYNFLLNNTCVYGRDYETHGGDVWKPDGALPRSRAQITVNI